MASRPSSRSSDAASAAAPHTFGRHATTPITSTERDQLLAFLLALTDERVRTRKAPFDHPQLFVPNGHPGSTTSVTNDGFGYATDSLTEIPPTGRNGGTPLLNFLGL